MSLSESFVCAEELEAALMENQQLKQKVQQGEQLKGQHDGLLERLRGARQELDQALAQKQQSDLAMGSLQQRVRAMAAKQALSRETEHRMATRSAIASPSHLRIWPACSDKNSTYMQVRVIPSSWSYLQQHITMRPTGRLLDQ